jgi:hypothetical protein
MVGFVHDGRPPHYTELAHQLVGLPTWLAQNTDYIASFAPFSSIPTQYLVTVDGQQRWYAQCGFESLAISWLFPGKEIRIALERLGQSSPFWRLSPPQ